MRPKPRSALVCAGLTFVSPLFIGCARSVAADTPESNVRPSMPPTTATSMPPTTTTTTSTTTTTTTLLPPEFSSSITKVSVERLGLSWRPGCPVGAADLRLVTVGFWGFDGLPHAGEVIVHRSIAERIATAFHELWDARFPINRLETAERFAVPEDFDSDGRFIERHAAPDTVNNTSAFFCRPTTGGTGWSQHSYGTAIDINPVQNPYVSARDVIPSNGQADRTVDVPGMVTPRSPVVEAMTRAGLRWGGTWRSKQDYMHFSVTGR